jgi:hypothetical protein
LIAVVSSVYFLLVEKPCMNPNWPAELRASFNRFAKRDETSAPAAVE